MTPEPQAEKGHVEGDAPPLPYDLGSLLSELKAAIQAEDRPRSALAITPGSSLKSMEAAIVASAILEMSDMKRKMHEIQIGVHRTFGGADVVPIEAPYVKPGELFLGLPGADFAPCKQILATLVSEGILEEGFRTWQGTYGGTHRESDGYRVRAEMRDVVRRAAPRR